MPNKTIYVKDEALWNRAKAIAGKSGAGLSGVITDALAAFVRNHEAAAAAQKIHRFLVNDDENPLEKIAFGGIEIASRSFANDDGPAPYIAKVYATTGGNFVLTLGLDGEKPVFHYASFKRPGSIVDDEVLKRIADENEIFEWANEVRERHFEETARETWIE